MAFRSDLTIDWYKSPRLIEVASPSTELTMQDLHDTLRAHEDDLVNLAFPKIVASSGKEQLDATTKVGITVTLQNAQVSFEARPGPSYILCSFIGGNLVSVDTDGVTVIESLFPTAFVTLSKTSSASATLQEQDALQYASFGGEVSVDITAPTTGTEFPSGTQEFPVNNIVDAVTIASTRGFLTLGIRTSMTLDTGDDVRNLALHGISSLTTVLTVNPGALCLKTRFQNFDITGTLDGDSDIRDCLVRTLDYVNGRITDSSLIGTITLAGSQDALLDNCQMLEVTSAPIINCGGSGQHLAMSHYSGRLVLDNLTGAGEVAVGVAAGEVVINATCTGGIIAIAGTGALIDNSGTGCYVTDRLVNGDKIASLQLTIEHLRGHHTGSGTNWYWDPFSGDDTWDGLSQQRPFKTFAVAQAAAASANHDIVNCLSTDPSGITTTNEAITISKTGILLRGPGRSFTIKSTSTTVPAITITAGGVEVSGMQIETVPTSTVDAIYSTGNFTMVRSVFVADSANGIQFDGGSFGAVLGVQCTELTGYGVKVSGAAKFTKLEDLNITTGTGNGIEIDLTVAGSEVNIIGETAIHNNTGFGITIGANSDRTFVGSGVQVFNNTAGKVDDNGTNTFFATTAASPLTPDQSGLIDRTAHIEAKVFVNTELIPAGDGTQAIPFNTFNAAKDFAETEGITTMVILGEVTLTSALKGFVIEGLGVATVHTAGYDCDKSKFFQCTLDNAYLGTIIAQECVLESGMQLDGFFEKCLLYGTTTCRDGASVLIANSFSGETGAVRPIISMNGAGASNLGIRNYSGNLCIANAVNALDAITVEVAQGDVLLTADNTAGTITVRGLTAFTDDSAGSTVIDQTSYNTIKQVDRLINYNEGTWKIIADQMIYFNIDGSELMRFNLLDSGGQPTSRGAMQRIKV